MFGRVVDDDPAVGSLIVVARVVLDGRPEQSLALRRRPYASVDLVRDVRLGSEPLDDRRRVQRA